MTSIDEHKKKIKEHLGEIADAIDEGIEKKPITIGFHCSSCAIQFVKNPWTKVGGVFGFLITLKLHSLFSRAKMGRLQRGQFFGLEMYLHSTNRIPVGKIVKHDWFKRPHEGQKIEPLIERKLKVDFPRKKEIYDLIYELEDGRNALVYGKPYEEEIKKVIELFSKLKEMFKEILKNEGIEI